MVENAADYIINSQQISLMQDALNEHTYHLVKFKHIQKCYKKANPVPVVYEVHSSYVPRSSDWVGLFQADWVSPLHYLTFEWVNCETDKLRGIEFSLDKIALPINVKYQFLYINSDERVLGASPVFEISDDDQSETDMHTTGSLTQVSLSSESLASKSDSQGSFEMLEVHEESPSKLEELAAEVLSNMEPQKKSSDHITLTDTFEPTGESIFNWLKDLEVKEDDENRTLDIEDISAETQTGQTALQAIEETDENNNLPHNVIVSYERKQLENLKPLHLSQLQVQLLSHRLKEDLGEKSSYETRKMGEKFKVSLNNVPPNSEVASAVLPEGSATCKCEKKTKELTQDRSKIQKRLTKVSSEKRRLVSKLKDVQDVCDFRRTLLDRLTDLVKSQTYDKNSLQVTNNMLSKHVSALQQEVALKKKDQLQAATSASMVPKLVSENLTLKENLLELTHKKDELNEKLPKLAIENEKLKRDMGELRKQHQELQDQHEDILHTLSTNGVNALLRKRSDGNISVIATDKTSNNFNVTSEGLQTTGKMLELENWRNVKGRRSAKHLRMINRQQDRIENLTNEIEEWKKNLRNESETKSQLRKELKASHSANKDLADTVKELENMNSLLVETLTMLSEDAWTIPPAKITVANAAFAHGLFHRRSSSPETKTWANKSINTGTDICRPAISNPWSKKLVTQDATTNTPIVKTTSTSTNTEQEDAEKITPLRESPETAETEVENIDPKKNNILTPKTAETKVETVDTKKNNAPPPKIAETKVENNAKRINTPPPKTPETKLENIDTKKNNAPPKTAETKLENIDTKKNNAPPPKTAETKVENKKNNPPPRKEKLIRHVKFPRPTHRFPNYGCGMPMLLQPTVHEPLINRLNGNHSTNYGSTSVTTFQPTDTCSVSMEPESPSPNIETKGSQNFKNINFSANPELPGSSTTVNDYDGSPVDILDWGINTMISFANICDTELKNLSSYFGNLMKNDKSKTTSSEQKVDVMDEKPQSPKQSQLAGLRTLINLLEDMD